MKDKNLILRIGIVIVSAVLITIFLLINMAYSYKSSCHDMAKKRLESMVYAIPENVKAFMNDYDFEYCYDEKYRSYIKEIGCIQGAFSVYDFCDDEERGFFELGRGLQIAFVNRDGNELYNLEDVNSYTLWADINDEEGKAICCNLKAYFTEEQYDEVIVKYMDDEVLEDYRIEKTTGYYENDRFVPIEIVFYKNNKKTDSVKEYTLVNESVKDKESLETVTIYDSKYVKKHMKDKLKANDMIAELDIYEEMDSDEHLMKYYYNYECDEDVNDYGEGALFTTAKEYYTEKVAAMNVLGETDIVTEYADDKLISYGVINLNKENPSPEDAVAVRFSVCYGLDYLDKYVPSNAKIVKKLIPSLSMFCLILGFGILVIVFQEKRLRGNKVARNALISAIAREMKTPAEILKTSADRINETKNCKEGSNSKKYDEIICAEANHISELVSQMLICSRNMEAGYESEKKPVSVNEIAKNVCERYEILAEKKKVTIKVKERLESFIISADKKMMEIAVSGVVSKAVSLCDEGGKVVVEISPRSIGVSYEGKILDFYERKAIWNMTKNKHILDKNSPERGSLGLYAKLIKINGLEYYTYVGENGMEFNISKPLK